MVYLQKLKVPSYTREIVSKYGHKIKKGLELIASPEGEVFAAAAMVAGVTVRYGLQNVAFQRDYGPYIIAFDIIMVLLVLHSWKRLKE